MQKTGIGRRLIITGFFLLSLIPFFWLTNYCSSREHINNKTSIERKETTKSGEYKTNNYFAFSRFPIYPNSTYQEKSTEQAIQANEEPSDWWNDFWCGVKVSDILLAYFTLLLAIFTWKLWISTDKLWTTTEKTLTDLERPWIFLERIKIRKRDPSDIPNNWYIAFVFKNVGRMPAIIEECILKIEDSEIITELPDYKNAFPLICVSTLAVNEPFETNEIGKDPKFGIKDGKPIHYVAFGRLTYKELNGKIHHTGFAVTVSAHMPAAASYNNKNYTYYD